MSNVFEDAVASVKRRGFHDAEPPGYTDHGALMAQYVRLVEEVGELGRAQRKGHNVGICDELADVVIVAAQIAHLHDIDLEYAIRQKLTIDENRGHLHGEGES